MFIHIVAYIAFDITLNKKNDLTSQFNSYKKIKTIKTLYLGDSHVARSIDFTKLDSSYSLAYFGENNMMNYYKLKYIIGNKLAKPSYVVLPCDIVTYTQGYHLYRTNKYFYYSLIPFNEIHNLNSNKMEAYYDYFKIKTVPYSEWQYAFNRFNTNRKNKAYQEFSDRTKLEQNKDAEYFIQHELLINGDKNNFYSSSALNFLEKTIKICEENHIKLIFIKFPLTKTIFDEIKYNVDSTYIYNRPSEKIIKKHTLPILNFEFLFENDFNLFFDSHHMNQEGQKQFTIILKQKLDSLYKVY